MWEPPEPWPPKRSSVERATVSSSAAPMALAVRPKRTGFQNVNRAAVRGLAWAADWFFFGNNNIMGGMPGWIFVAFFPLVVPIAAGYFFSERYGARVGSFFFGPDDDEAPR